MVWIRPTSDPGSSAELLGMSDKAPELLCSSESCMRKSTLKYWWNKPKSLQGDCKICHVPVMGVVWGLSSVLSPRDCNSNSLGMIVGSTDGGKAADGGGKAADGCGVGSQYLFGA